MRKIGLAVLLIIFCSGLSGGAAWADMIAITNPGSSYFDDNANAIAAKARWQNTGGEAVLGVTTLSSAADQYALWNPAGSPYWTPNTTYKFTLAYSAASGTATFSILNSGGGSLGSMTNTYDGSSTGEPNYVGRGFKYIRLNYVGIPPGGSNLYPVDITNLTYNGTQLGAGSYSSGGFDNVVYFADQNGALLTNFTIAGDFVFMFGGASERPRFEIDLGGPAAVPIPAAVWLLGSGLVGLVGLRRRMKR